MFRIKFLESAVLLCLLAGAASTDLAQILRARRDVDVIGFVAEPGDFRAQFKGSPWVGQPYKFVDEFPLLKTICLVDFYDKSLVDLAKRRHIKVLSMEKPSRRVVNDRQATLEWLRTMVGRSLRHGLDGLVFRYEEPVTSADERRTLNAFVTESARQLREANLTIGFEGPFSPVNGRNESTYGRNYDWKRIAALVDRFVVTVYDQYLAYQPEQGDDCVAMGDASLYNMLGGILAYADLGVALRKMSIVLPLYGLDYQCVAYADNMQCRLGRDAAGHCTSRVAEKVILNAQPPNDGRVGIAFWDEHSSTAYDVYLERAHGLLHKYFYERPDTLDLKVRQGLQFDLAGFGYWPMNAYNHTFGFSVADNPLPRKLP